MNDENYSWNYGDLFDEVEKVVPAEKPALIHGDKVISWKEFSARTNNTAQNLINDGFKPNEKIAFYMRNCTEYTEAVIASFKSRLVHVNVNFRYQAEEVNYILSNSDSAIVIFAAEFSDIVSNAFNNDNQVRLWLYVEDDSGIEPPAFAKPYADYASRGNGKALDIKRDPKDIMLMYTGGTTGMPKGVMWEQQSLRQGLLIASNPINPPKNCAEHIALLLENGFGRSLLACPPLMHGTSVWTSIHTLSEGGTIATMPGKTFDPELVWEMASKYRLEAIIIVGDVLARPLLTVLDKNADNYDLTSVANMASSGVIWSLECKQRLLEYLPHCILVDALGSSEGIGIGASAMTKDGMMGMDKAQTGKFMAYDAVKVFSEDGREILPGSDEPGLIARCAPIPMGYYKDPEKTAKTFKTYNGKRYSIPGDFCRIAKDGSITLLGRGSGCINTGGEKVFPEEVEEALKRHPNVEDALVFGVDSARWGQEVSAVVRLENANTFDREGILASVREQLAGYKIPKKLFDSADSYRAPNGKPDYVAAKTFFHAQLSR